ncbi:MAG TPA: zinc-binding alcohol dehydrogenase family protein [Candidatus Bathyarchaeia archaeon]|nr:zinc-binding alcohol dehydrogenase family protein [Candidatus Bathyarchaeia archaeon]
MNAAVVSSFDTPPRYTTFANPVAAEQEVVVTVTAAGLHPVVKSQANGSHYASPKALPFIPGVDGVGRLEDGTRVYFGISRMPFGTFAEHCVTGRSMCLPIPDALGDATAAALLNPGMSSWAALTARAQFVAGDSVLILGATGVAGQLAVQTAKRLGARRVVAVGRNPQVLENLQPWADAVISLNLEQEALISSFRGEWAKDAIDVVLDYLWGAPAERVLEAISQKGFKSAASRIRFVQIGASAGPTISLPAASLRSSALELMGSGFGSVSIAKILQSAADFISEAAREPFQIKVDTAPLSEVAALWNVPQEGARRVFQP